MSQDTPRNPITLKPLVYSTSDADAVTPRRDVTFTGADGGELLMDLYYPPTRTDQRLPVVLLVAGYNDVGFERMLGCRFKAMESVAGWGRLLAASGMVAIAYTNRDPVPDAHALLRHLHESAAALHLDVERLALWACSGHGPAALWVLMANPRAKCAALLYPYTMDLGGSLKVAEAQKSFKFAGAGEGESIEDLPDNVPIFIARAGKDEMPGLNDALDRFVTGALLRNLPISIVNHAAGPHAFDLMDNSRRSREIIEQTLSFLRFHLEITQ